MKTLDKNLHLPFMFYKGGEEVEWPNTIGSHRIFRGSNARNFWTEL